MGDEARKLEEFLRGLFEPLGGSLRAEVVDEGDRIYINLVGEVPEGRDFREALSHLLRLYLRRERSRRPFVVDVNGEERRRERAVVSRARELAARAVREGRKVELEPMPPAYRRLVHIALSDYPGVRTYSVGEGEERRVVIEPVNPEGERP